MGEKYPKNKARKTLEFSIDGETREERAKIFFEKSTIDYISHLAALIILYEEKLKTAKNSFSLQILGESSQVFRNLLKKFFIGKDAKNI